ncbi:hypothetical protein GCM10026982_13310 [Nocardiopsis aegyptia]
MSGYRAKGTSTTTAPAATKRALAAGGTGVKGVTGASSRGTAGGDRAQRVSGHAGGGRAHGRAGNTALPTGCVRTDSVPEFPSACATNRPVRAGPPGTDAPGWARSGGSRPGVRDPVPV